MNEGKEERSTDWLEGWNDSIATPAYVFDLDELKDRLQMIRRCLGSRIQLCYAMKANPFLVAPLQNFVDKYEVCSPGEFRICERHQVPMEQIVLSGVYKEEREICHAVETYGGKGTFTIESKQQLEILGAVPQMRERISGRCFGFQVEINLEWTKNPLQKYWSIDGSIPMLTFLVFSIIPERRKRS